MRDSGVAQLQSNHKLLPDEDDRKAESLALERIAQTQLGAAPKPHSQLLSLDRTRISTAPKPHSQLLSLDPAAFGKNAYLDREERCRVWPTELFTCLPAREWRWDVGGDRAAERRVGAGAGGERGGGEIVGDGEVHQGGEGEGEPPIIN